MTSYKKCLLIFLTASGLSACGGGSDNQSTGTTPPVGDTLVTGKLQGTAIEGLRYATESQSALTNSNGEFRFREGETITFSIGGTDFPITQADTELNPFTITGLNPLVQETDIISALSTQDGNSFDTAINISNLLQSLDSDGNPSNGINLGNADVQLQNVSIPLQVKANTFSQSPEFIQVRQILNVPSIRTLSEVIGFLYQDLGIEVISSQPARQISITEGRARALSYSYDNDGQLLSLAQDTDNDGTVDIVETFSYDSTGKVTSITNSAEQTEQTMAYDANGNLVSRETEKNGQPLSVESYSFVNNQLQTFQYTGVAEAESSSVSYEYDPNNRLSGYIIDIEGTDASDIRSSFQYDGDLVSRVDEDRDNDGTIDLSIRYTYESNGNVQTQTTIETVDGIQVETLARFFYDESNNISRYEEDRNGDSRSDYIEYYEYNEGQQRTQYRKDMNADGNWDSIAYFTYDQNGNLIRMLEDSNNDGFGDVYWEAQIEGVAHEAPNWQGILDQALPSSS